jgi:hypothetical protein
MTTVTAANMGYASLAADVLDQLFIFVRSLATVDSTDQVAQVMANAI